MTVKNLHFASWTWHNSVQSAKSVYYEDPLSITPSKKVDVNIYLASLIWEQISR